MSKSVGLSVVVPVYNSERTIGELIDRLSTLRVDDGMELVLVNDGSRDDAGRVCRAAAERARIPITVIELARNFGEHNAVIAGLHYARGEYVVTLDDDLQNPPEEVARLYRHARAHRRDVVYAQYESHEQSWWRNAGSALTGWCSNRLLDKPKDLYLSTFRCMSAFAVAQVVAHTGPYPYVDGLLLQATQNVDGLVVGHRPRAAGRSNYTCRPLVRLWLSVFLNFSVVPLRVATVVGLIMAALGGAGLVAVVIEALTGGPPAGWASLMAVVLLLAGVQLTMLGLIGEYLGRLFLTVNGKPQFVVRDITRSGAHAATPLRWRPGSARWANGA